MNSFPSYFRSGPALHQMVQGQGVVNSRIVNHRWGCSLASRPRGSTTAWRKSCALGNGAFSLCPPGRGFMQASLKQELAAVFQSRRKGSYHEHNR